MSPRNEEILYHLLSVSSHLLRPTWSNLHDSFDTWANRHQLSRRLAELERLQLIERPPGDLARVARLTEAGRLAALGGRDPAERWGRRWDGHWRLVVFDLPLQQRALRIRLWRTLKAHRFGYLQDSVWVSPDFADDLRGILAAAKADTESFLMLEGRPAAGETDADIVRGAWKFPAINRRYGAYLAFARRGPSREARLVEWGRHERTL